jgi:hypothetical protein
MGKEKKYFIGKLDRNSGKTGPRNCKAYLTWELKDGRFAMCGEVWNHIGTDMVHAGQCVDAIAAQFPHDAKAQRMLAIWRRYHLNDMKAGSAVQEEWLRANPIDPAEYAYPKSHYEVASAKLAAAGLNPDADGYRYGSAWKAEPLPAEVVAEIESWG